MDQRPLPPLERRAGQQCLRVEHARSDQPGLFPSGDDGGHLPDRPHPSRDHRPGRRHGRAADGRSVHARSRVGGGTQRAHPGRPLADGGPPARDARGGRRADPAAVVRRGGHLGGPALPGRPRARLQPSGDAPGDLRLGLRSEGDRAGGADRRRLRQHGARCRDGPRLQGPVRWQARPAGAKVAYAPTPEEGWEHAHRLWPNAGVPGELAQVLPTPEHFEQASSGHHGLHPRLRGRRPRPGRSPGADRGLPPGGLRRPLRREHGAPPPRDDRVLRRTDPAVPREPTASSFTSGPRPGRT